MALARPDPAVGTAPGPHGRLSLPATFSSRTSVLGRQLGGILMVFWFLRLGGALAFFDKYSNALDEVGPFKQWDMALVSDLNRFQAGMTRAHGIQGRRGKDVGPGAADDQDRRARERVEFVPQ